MNRYTFPYGIRFQEDSRIEVFPAVELSVTGRAGKGIRAVFHIDSGATTSALPFGDATVLGLNLKDGKKTLIRGITDVPLIGYRHIVKVQLGSRRLVIPMLFAQLESFPRILGREGVFSAFGILFDETRQRTGFLDARKERETLNALLGA